MWYVFYCSVVKSATPHCPYGVLGIIHFRRGFILYFPSPSTFDKRMTKNFCHVHLD